MAAGDAPVGLEPTDLPAENAAALSLSPEDMAQAALDLLFGISDRSQDGASAKKDLAADLDVTGGDLTFGEDIAMDDMSLMGLREELERFHTQEVVANILSQGSELRDFALEVEGKLRVVELESIQDYIKESDNLVSLHDQIKLCDTTLTQMEALLGGFQSDLGAISAEIKSLQEKSMGMGIKLRNRKSAEGKLGRFLEDIVVPPELIRIIVDGEISEAFVRALHVLSRKLHFVNEDSVAKTSAGLRDVQPELERLRVKAVTKARDFLMQRLWALRKPKTNIQILQQNVLLKFKYLATFLREHGNEVYAEVMGAYVDTMNKVLSLHFRTYIMALEKLQLDIVTKNDLIGEVDSKGIGLFARSRDLKNRSAVFSLGDRSSLLKDLEQPAIIPHIAEASSQKYPYEVLFRSLHKLLMDTATSEYLFCLDFFGDEVTFNNIFTGPFAVIDEHLQSVLPNCYDAIGLMLMIRMTYQHQLTMSRRRVPCLDAYFDKLNILIWPRFKMVFDLHLQSVRQANPRSLWEDDNAHPHYVMRRYAEFTSSMMQLNTDYGDGQLELNLDRLRVAVDNFLVELSRLFPKQKQRVIFLINNYDLLLAVLKEAGVDGGRMKQQSEEILDSFTTVFVEEELREHFGKLIEFVKTRAGTGEEPTGTGAGPSPGAAPITLQEVEPLLKDFSSRWRGAIELIHKDVITNFSNFVCGMDILRAALTQLLLYYTRLSDCLKRVGGGAALVKDVVSIPSIMYEIRKYSRTF